MTEKDLVPVRRQIERMATSLFAVVGIPFEQTSELQRQVIAAFAFGMVFATGQVRQLSPPEVHALAISSLMDVFHYSAQQAADFANLLIEAASDSAKEPTMNAIIHRGIDGHLQWRSGLRQELRNNLTGVLQEVCT